VTRLAIRMPIATDALEAINAAVPAARLVIQKR
jgi:hypothetical protein